MYAEYKKARGGHALSTDQILTINAAGSGQICDNFGVHHKLPKVKELYDDGDAAFFANMGHLARVSLYQLVSFAFSLEPSLLKSLCIFRINCTLILNKSL